MGYVLSLSLPSLSPLSPPSSIHFLALPRFLRFYCPRFSHFSCISRFPRFSRFSRYSRLSRFPRFSRFSRPSLTSHFQLWDVVPDAAVIRHIQEHSTEHAQEIADGLVGLAIQKQSVDNITCVVIKCKN